GTMVTPAAAMAADWRNCRREGTEVIAGSPGRRAGGSFCRKPRGLDKARWRGGSPPQDGAECWDGRLILTTSHTNAAMTSTGTNGTNNAAATAARTAATTAITGVRTAPTIAT